MLSKQEREQLQAFRRLAREIRQASVVVSNEPLRLNISVRVGKPIQHTLSGRPSEAFRSFMISLRKALLQKDRTHIGRIRSLVYRLGSAEVKEQAEAIKDTFQEILEGEIAVAVDEQSYTHEEILDRFLYGGAFHDQNEAKQREFEGLERALGLMPSFITQATALRLGYCVLDLDNLVADLLGEPRLPPLED